MAERVSLLYDDGTFADFFGPETLYRCLDKLVAHTRAFFSFLRDRWETLFEAHIFIAYCLHVTLKNLARPRAPRLTPRAILDKFAALQMVDVHLPTADGRHLVLPRHTQPERDHQLLLDQLKLRLPEQLLPRISA